MFISYLIGNINILAFIFGALCILVAIAFSFSISRFSQRDARYTLQEEKRSGKFFFPYFFKLVDFVVSVNDSIDLLIFINYFSKNS